MKIGFSVDTNILQGKNSENTGFKKNVKFFLDYIKAFKRKDKSNELIFYLTSLVKDEVLNHKKEKMNEEYNKFCQCYGNIKYFIDGEIPRQNIDKVIEEELKFLNKVNILSLPMTQEIFDDILKRSIEKIPPFLKNNGDSGFKDSFIWETILNSKEIDDCDIFYYFTCDKDFINENLEQNFRQYHKNTKLNIIYIENNDQKRQNILTVLINDNHLIETDITTLFNEEVILPYIKELQFENIEIMTSDNTFEKALINYNMFSCSDFDIIDVEKIDNNTYNIKIYIKTYNHSKKILIPIYGDMNMTFHKTSTNKFKPLSHNVSNMKYGTMMIDRYIKDLNKLTDSFSIITNSPIFELSQNIEISNFSKVLESTAIELHKYNEPIKIMTNSLISATNQLSNYWKNINDSLPHTYFLNNYSKYFESCKSSDNIFNELKNINAFTDGMSSQNLSTKINDNQEDKEKENDER